MPIKKEVSRMAMSRARSLMALPAAAAVLALASCSAVSHLTSGGDPPPQGSPSVSATPAPSHRPDAISVAGRQVCMRRCRYLGVALAAQSDFGPYLSSTGVRPQLVQTYASFGSAFPDTWAKSIAAQRMIPVLQVNPYKVSLSDIADGRYDSYLRSYGKAIRRFAFPVMLSFAHEMNGTWYPWGCHHTGAKVYVAAFRRFVRVIRSTGVHNVIWVWTANVSAKGYCALGARYPGNKYVTWVGLDGYLRKQGRTYNGIFGQSLAAIRGFAPGKPIVLAETGVLLGVPGDTTRLRDLYHGAAASKGVIGVVYFDAKTAKFGDYRPQDDPAMLAVYRQETKWYSSGASSNRG
jgi:mannan endo-1,4-beta-mannosidase